MENVTIGGVGRWLVYTRDTDCHFKFAGFSMTYPNSSIIPDGLQDHYNYSISELLGSKRGKGVTNLIYSLGYSIKHLMLTPYQTGIAQFHQHLANIFVSFLHHLPEIIQASMSI